MVRVLINGFGEVEGARVHKSSGFPLLDDAALAAAARAKYRPYSFNGVVKKAYMLVPVKFELDPPESPKPFQSKNEMP